MPTPIIQRAFASGELGPELGGRADQVKYQTGLATCRNFLVMRHGGITRRPGQKFAGEAKTSSLASYMARFVFNDDQTYLIEVGNGYFRFYRAGARIVVSGVAAWSGATAYVVGDLVVSGGVNYYCILAHTNHVPANATYWYALTGSIYEIPTPYATADLSMLRFTQSADVITITHKSYDTRELRRTGHTAWTLVTKSFGSSIAAPGSIAVDHAGTGAYYTVTAVDGDTFEESSAGTPIGAAADGTVAVPNIVTWAAVTNARYYNVYRTSNGVYSFIGIAGSSLSFFDDGITPDPSVQPPITRDLFSGANKRPACATYYQQRLILASTNDDLEAVFGSRSGLFDNFTISSPIRADDAVKFSMGDTEVQEVRHVIGVLKLLLVFTANSVRRILGDSTGTLRPDAINPVQQSGFGSSTVPPVVIGDSILYVQARGSNLRDLSFDLNADGYVGQDLTVFSPHLFEGFTLLKIAYAAIPHSIAYMIRSDGALLTLTYIREQQIWGWARHDTDGYYEDVCVLPEGEEDAVYVIVRRVIAGTTKRFVERFCSPVCTDVKRNATTAFLDSFLSYDGRNAGSTTMTLTGSNWIVDADAAPLEGDTPEPLTLTASGATFSAADVGNVIVLRVSTLDDDGVVVSVATVRVTIAGYTSTTVVTGFPDVTVPLTIRGVATTDWDRSVDRVSGLDHLSGERVSVIADGNVLDDVTVQDGAINLNGFYAVVHAGLPYTSDMETLDLDIAGQQIRGLQKDVKSIQLLVKNSRGIQAGPDADNLSTFGSDGDDALALFSGMREMTIASTWKQSGRFFVRQSDPLPLTILAAIPTGELGG